MPPPRLSKVALAARILLVPYAMAVALIVWLPASIASRVTGLAFRLARWVAVHFDIGLSTSYTVFEFLANIALFVPLGILLVVGWPRWSPWLVILLGYAASATIELVQSLLPSRFPTLSDVVANTLGTIGGVLLVWLVLNLAPSRPQPAPSTLRA